MKDEIEAAIKRTASNIKASSNHIEAMQYSQAVLNLANSLVALRNIE